MKKFDGKSESEKNLNDLKSYISANNIKKKLVAILVGDDNASQIYTKLKQIAAKKIGINMQILKLNSDVSFENLSEKINTLNSDENINGIMIQLPLPDELKDKTNSLINQIDKNKDVDGMREDSGYLSATTKAVKKIFDIVDLKNPRIAIVGYKGEVGKRLVKIFNEYSLIKLDIGDNLEELRNADVVISATGKENLISEELIKKGSVLIDVGAPKAEFKKECYEKASFYTPVPGGVGPMTVACLMENIIQGPAN